MLMTRIFHICKKWLKIFSIEKIHYKNFQFKSPLITKKTSNKMSELFDVKNTGYIPR
jgi:hypothetical protein